MGLGGVGIPLARCPRGSIFSYCQVVSTQRIFLPTPSPWAVVSSLIA